MQQLNLTNLVPGLQNRTCDVEVTRERTDEGLFTGLTREGDEFVLVATIRAVVVRERRRELSPPEPRVYSLGRFIEVMEVPSASRGTFFRYRFLQGSFVVNMAGGCGSFRPKT